VGSSREPPASNISTRLRIFIPPFFWQGTSTRRSGSQGVAGLRLAQKTRPETIPDGPPREENLNQHLLECDPSRFQVLCLRQIDRQNTLVDASRNPVGID